ncbi:MAG: ABC transporter ATP-binding protein [Candidatus Dormibacteria bacterium]
MDVRPRLSQGIIVDDLRKTFGSGRRGSAKVEAVAGITCSIDAGERCAFIGPNGAGKSTSIKMLTGILRPTSGRASVLGLVPWEERRILAKRIGTLFGQRSQLWFQLTPRRTYALLARMYGVESSHRDRRLGVLGELLDAAHLYDRPVRTLSLGERMRCELVASLLHEPELLFLDEPTIGLDLVAKTRFRDLIVRINEEQQTTIFLTSHDVSDIERVANRVIIINHGRIVFDDSVQVLRQSLLKRKIISVRFEDAISTLTVKGAEVVSHDGAVAQLDVNTEATPIRSVLDTLLEQYPVADISVEDPPLEEIVSHMYERKS